MASMEGEWVDWYEVLGVGQGASRKEVSRAFKRLALLHHPDRNEGDARAAERFLLVSKANEVLGDEPARAAFDASLRARQQRRRRDEAMDEGRRALKAKLNEREGAAKRQRVEEERARRGAEEHLHGLREDLLRRKRMEQERQEEEQERKQKHKQARQRQRDIAKSGATIKVRWRKARGHDERSLADLFAAFGPVELVVVSKSGKRALVSFLRPEDARLAMSAQQEGPLGPASCPLTSVVIDEPQPHDAPAASSFSASSTSPSLASSSASVRRAPPAPALTPTSQVDHEELERQTLMFLGQAHLLAQQTAAAGPQST